MQIPANKAEIKPPKPRMTGAPIDYDGGIKNLKRKFSEMLGTDFQKLDQSKENKTRVKPNNSKNMNDPKQPKIDSIFLKK